MVVGISLALGSCSKSMNDYENVTIEHTDSISGAVVFKTSEGLEGVADKDGEIILKPKFGSITIDYPFIEAKLSEKEFNDENKKMAEKAGYKEGREYTREEMKKIVENLAEQKHPYLRAGYGNSYSRLYNFEGKMLKDYQLQGTMLHLQMMGDTVVWTGGVPEEKELINRAGVTTPLKDYYFSGSNFGYRTKDGFTFVKYDGRWEELFGKLVGGVNGFIVLKGTNSDPNAQSFSFKGPNGFVYVNGWDIVAWKEDKINGGIFVKIKEGEVVRGEKRHFRSRPTDFRYISKEGTAQKLPPGYTVRQISYDKNDADLYGPDGRRISTLWWHD